MLRVIQRQYPADPRDHAAIAAAIRARSAPPYLLGGSLRGSAYARRAPGLLDWGLPEVAAIVGKLRALLDEHAPPTPHWRLHGWGNLNRAGDSNAPHHHGLVPGHWTAIYYVDAGDGPPARTAFHSHEHAPPTLYVEPSPGLMLLFPAYTCHSVEPYHGTGERITLAFNAEPEA